VDVSACTKAAAVEDDGEVMVLCFSILEGEGMVICQRWFSIIAVLVLWVYRAMAE
jgi:hypothetical protein